MPGKAKTQKHTAKELKGKAFEATVNRGGGAAGVNDRKVSPCMWQRPAPGERRVRLPDAHLFTLVGASMSSRRCVRPGQSASPRLQGGKAGHAKFKCPICALQAPSIKNMREHFEAKHPKAEFSESACTDLQAAHGGSTQGVAVKGGNKK